MNENLALDNARILPLKVLGREIKPKEKKLESGIILPDVKKPSTMSAEVVMVGEGTKEIPMTVKVGDTILFTPMSAVRFQYEDEELMLLDQNSVLFMFRQ